MSVSILSRSLIFYRCLLSPSSSVTLPRQFSLPNPSSACHGHFHSVSWVFILPLSPLNLSCQLSRHLFLIYVISVSGMSFYQPFHVLFPFVKSFTLPFSSCPSCVCVHFIPSVMLLCQVSLFVYLSPCHDPFPSCQVHYDPVQHHLLLWYVLSLAAVHVPSHPAKAYVTLHWYPGCLEGLHVDRFSDVGGWLGSWRTIFSVDPPLHLVLCIVALLRVAVSGVYSVTEQFSIKLLFAVLYQGDLCLLTGTRR